MPHTKTSAEVKKTCQARQRVVHGLARKVLQRKPAQAARRLANRTVIAT